MSPPMKTIQNCWNSATILPTPVAVAVGPQPDVMKELSDMLLLFAQAGETDAVSAEDMCEIEEELLTAIPIGVDEDEVEILALAEACRKLVLHLKTTLRTGCQYP